MVTYAACVPGGTAGDDTVVCTGTVNGFQRFRGGNDHVTLLNVAGNGYYWLDKYLYGDPATDGNDSFYVRDSHFVWVAGLGGDDYFEINGSDFSNLYADIVPPHANQRGSDTILIRNSTANGWILGGNDNDHIEIHDSNISQLASGYSDTFDISYSQFDGNDHILLDHVNFTIPNYIYTTFPGVVEMGDGNDSIEMVGGGEGFSIFGGYGDDVISIRDGEHFHSCSYRDERNISRRCGIYGDEEYSLEHNISHDDAYMSSHHGDDVITIDDADIRGLVINGGHGSDHVTIKTPVSLDGAELDGGDDASIADGFVDWLVFERWSGDLNASLLHGWEQITIDDFSDIVLGGNELNTSTDLGTDPLNGMIYGLSLIHGTQVKIPSDLTINGNLQNDAEVNLSDGGLPGEVLTINGDYGSNGGVLDLDVVLGSSISSKSDTLHIRGDTSGTTQLHIDNIGGAGGETTGDGILLIEVDGDSRGVFVLDRSPIDIGDYLYTLYLHTDGNWYLRSQHKKYSLTLTKRLKNNADEDHSGDMSLDDTLTYEIVATNTGNMTQHHLIITDERITPSSVTCETLAPSQRCLLSGKYIITQNDIDRGILDNNASCKSDENQTSTSLTISLDQSPKLTLNKILQNNTDEDQSGDISFGDTLTYEITATNSGNLTLHHITITDDKITPSITTCETLAPSQTCKLVGTYTVTQDDMDTARIDNNATVASDELAVQTVSLGVELECYCANWSHDSAPSLSWLFGLILFASVVMIAVARGELPTSNIT